MNLHITAVDLADPDDSTHVTHGVTLSNGELIEVWAHKPCYIDYPSYTGPLQTGAELVGVEYSSLEDGPARPQVLHFKA